MKPVVKYPVYDLDSQLLVQEGTELTSDFMDDFCREKRRKHPFARLFEYGDVQKDLLNEFLIPPYDVIFSREETKTRVLGLLADVVLPLPVLQVMDYFRNNDFHTYRHMLIISALTTLILEDLAPLNGNQGKECTHFGPLHDLGKYTVPLPILMKETPLTAREQDRLKHHAVAGYVLVSHYLGDHGCLSSLIALDHHERRNGTGYSRGIELLNLVVEVTTVCDIYDALVATRPYRPLSFDNRTALEELTSMARRGEIGWAPVRALVAYNRKKKTSVEEVAVSLERRGSPPRQNVYGMLSEEE